MKIFETVLRLCLTDYIFVGNLNAAYSGRTLCRNNIDSIIDMSCVPGELSPYMSDTLFDGQPLKLRCFEDINECINASTEKRKRVLVHCRDGFSLAPTCIIQYLMVKQNMRLIAAYELLRLLTALKMTPTPLERFLFYEQDPNNQRSSSTLLDYM
uniref:protein-tyrosine-phosphatase n=1 Tax=Oryzias latipes TaxID=8090 RepID=A0A3P9K6R1_ORYLA